MSNRWLTVHVSCCHFRSWTCFDQCRHNTEWRNTQMKNGTDIWYKKENEHISQFNDLGATGNVQRTRRYSKLQVLCIITATFRCIQQWVHLACHQQHRNVDASTTLAYEYEYIPSVGDDITITGGVVPYVRLYVYLPAKGVRECYSNVCEYPFH